MTFPGNWSEPDRDYAQSALKTSINACLASRQEKVDNCRQVPKYGFLLHSQVLVPVPDLKVMATFARANTAGEDESVLKASILVQRMLGPDIMLCLLNQTPPELKSIELTLPPH